jgi:hypothetical protein
MTTMDKHIELLKALAEKTTLLQQVQRINIEQKRAPHFRTYCAVGKPMTTEATRAIEDLAEGLTLTANVFRAGGQVNAITFVDFDEQGGQQ